LLLVRTRHTLIEMPTRRWARASTAKFSGEPGPELQDPSPHRFVGDIQPTLSEQIFDVAKAKRKMYMSLCYNGRKFRRREGDGLCLATAYVSTIIAPQSVESFEALSQAALTATSNVDDVYIQCFIRWAIGFEELHPGGAS
jgi:hypothetical protein